MIITCVLLQNFASQFPGPSSYFISWIYEEISGHLITWMQKIWERRRKTKIAAVVPIFRFIERLEFFECPPFFYQCASSSTHIFLYLQIEPRKSVAGARMIDLCRMQKCFFLQESKEPEMPNARGMQERGGKTLLFLEFVAAAPGNSGN